MGAQLNHSSPVTLVAGPLRLVFAPHGDRLAHRIELRESGALLLDSIEGSPADDWPPSPPLQELQLTSDQGAIALLVGMAGRSHWSVSAECAVRPTPRVMFDFACRLHTPATWLGNRYRLGPDVQAVTREDSLNLNLGNSPPVAILRGENCRLETSAREISLRAPAAGENFPHTIRWQFSIEIAAD